MSSILKGLVDDKSFKPKKLVIFDIDDTLVYTQTKVHVIKDGQVVNSLNSHDFTHYKLKPGESFDFGDFRNARDFFYNSKPNIPMMNQLKRDINTGNKVVMVTARADFDDKELFLDTFRKFGVDINKVHVYRAGNSKEGTTEERKKLIIKKLLNNGDYDKAIMYDDAKPNLHTFMELKKEHPETRFYAWHVSLDGNANEYMREQAEKSLVSEDNEGEGMQWEEKLMDVWAPVAAKHMAKVVKQAFNSLYPNVKLKVWAEAEGVSATTDLASADVKADVFGQYGKKDWECNFLCGPLYNEADDRKYLELMVDDAASGSYPGVWKIIVSEWKRWATSQLKKTGADDVCFSVDEDMSGGAWGKIATAVGIKFIAHDLDEGLTEVATVTRIDSKPITDFASGLKTYKHRDDWSQSGLDTGDDSYWKNKNLKTSTTKGLFAGDPHRTALYSTGNAHETRYVEFTQNGQPIVYFDKKDLPKIRNRKTYLTVFDASNFRQLPTGEWFSENPGNPIKQMPISDPFKYIAGQGWKVRVTDNLDKVFKQVKKMHKAGKIAHYGAEGMNESKQGVSEALNYDREPLYHATLKAFEPSIIKSGLLPGGNLRMFDWSDKKYVYLSNYPDIARDFVDPGVIEPSQEHEDQIFKLMKQGGVIFKIDQNKLDRKLLMSDPHFQSDADDGAETYVYSGIIPPSAIIGKEYFRIDGMNESNRLYKYHQKLRKQAGLPDPQEYLRMQKQKLIELILLNDPNQELNVLELATIPELEEIYQMVKPIDEDNTYQFAAEKTPTVNPYAGIKDNQFRGAIGEGIRQMFEEPNYSPTDAGYQQGGWRVMYKDDMNEDLRKWFKEKWVRFGPDGKIRGACARGSSSEGKPKCLPQSKAHSLGKKGRASAAARKRREDPDPNRSGAAKNVATKKKKSNEANNMYEASDISGLLAASHLNKSFIITADTAEGKTKKYRVKAQSERAAKEKFLKHHSMAKILSVKEEGVNEEKCPHCNGPMFEMSLMNEKKDACYYKVKSRYKVWPSAYASGALVKCRKKGAKNWGNKSESAVLKGIENEGQIYSTGGGAGESQRYYTPKDNLGEAQVDEINWRKAAATGAVALAGLGGLDASNAQTTQNTMPNQTTQSMSGTLRGVTGDQIVNHPNYKKYYQQYLRNPNSATSHQIAQNMATTLVKRDILAGIKEQLDELKCWPGYKRVKGVPQDAPGSCKKKTKESSIMKGLVQPVSPVTSIQRDKHKERPKDKQEKPAKPSATFGFSAELEKFKRL